MNFATATIISLGVAAFLCLASILAKLKKQSTSLVRKILALLLVAVTFTRYMLAEDAFKAMNTQGLNMWSPFGDDIGATILSMLLIWFSFSVMLTVAVDAFMEARVLRHMTIFFGIPVLLCDICFFTTYIIGVVGSEAYSSGDVRIPLMAIEIGLALGLSISRIIEVEKKMLPTLSETVRLLWVLPVSILAIMPSNAPWVLIGNAFTPPSMELEGFTFEHRMALYFSIILPYIVYRVLKDRPIEQQKIALIYMNLAFLWVYIRHWDAADLSTPWVWPFNLCNTAMFIVPLCLIFGMKRLFNFTLFINVLGALLAMLMPDVGAGTNIVATYSLHFWLNHYSAFAMPILIMALGHFERPKLKQWFNSLVAFTVYFVLVISLNTYFTAIGHSTDYFFLNSDFVIDKLGDWAEKIFELSVTFTVGDSVCTLRPLYLVLFYIVYALLSVGVWFIYALLFKLWDDTARSR